MIGTLDFARPSLLVLLALILVVLWFARRAAARPDIDVTGTLEIWKRSAGEIPRSSAKPRIPPAVWWLVAAIATGVIALAGPRTKGTATSSRLLVVVDRSPSMYLIDGDRTRLERALDLARNRIASLAYADVAWIAPPITDDEGEAADSFRNEWLRAPRFSVDEPDPTSFDRTDVLFITDRTLENRLKKAGFCASGGAAVPGPIGVVGSRLIDWDGMRVLEGAPLEGTSVIVDFGVPPPIERIARAWATARGFPALEFKKLENASTEFDTHALGGLRQVLRLHMDKATLFRSSELGRDGWSARAEYSTTLTLRDKAGQLQSWLTTADGDAVVASATGRVYVALRTIEEPRGDPAAWAVSWSRLFDETLSSPEGCVSIVERKSALKSATRDPLRSSTAARESVGPWTAISAAVAAACALVAAWLALALKRTSPIRVP